MSKIEDLNIYDYVTFPFQNIREEAHDKYFNTVKLQYQLEKYLINNNLTKAITKNGYDIVFGLDESIQEDFREKIRRINNQLFTADLTILTLYNYYKLLHDNQEQENKDESTIIEILYRRECVKLSFEIFNIKEKFKTVIRIIYKYGIQKTKIDEQFNKKVKKDAERDLLLKQFYQKYKKFIDNKPYKFTRKIRNAEVHNEPIIDEMLRTYTGEGNLTFLVDPYYKISNKDLYDNLKKTLDDLLIVHDSIQTIIDNYKEKNNG